MKSVRASKLEPLISFIHSGLSVSDDKVLFYVVTGAFRLEGYEGGERGKAAVGLYDWRNKRIKGSAGNLIKF